MKETNSNLNKHTCSPVSSNCVIWEGPDISCINICRGDSISEVTAKLATELCGLMKTLDLSELDFSCLVSLCAECPLPEKTLITVLQFLISKICTITSLLPSGSSTTPTELSVAIATCFVENDSNGDPVTTLSLSEYVRRIGIKLCNLVGIVSTINDNLTTLDARVYVLEHATPPTFNIPTVIPTCTFSDSTPRTVDIVLTSLEKQFCQLRTVTGMPIAIGNSINQQCQGLASQQSFSAISTMSGLPGWVITPLTVADTLTNMWITICDMRKGLTTLTQSSSNTCSSIIIDFNTSTNTDRTEITLYFNANTVIPSGYTECSSGGSMLTITDSAGHSYTTYVQVLANATNTDGVTIDLSTTSLNSNLTYTLVLNACMKKNNVQCNQIITKTNTPPCGVVTGVSATLL